MHIVYSAFKQPASRNNKVLARYRGYRAACDKHSATIAAIRQYMPGWEPIAPAPVKGEQLKLA